MYQLSIEVRNARARCDVVAWWTGLSDDYRAQDPAEQPHRIKVVDRREACLEELTWWRTPWGRDMVIAETLHLRPDGDFAILIGRGTPAFSGCT